MSTVRPLTDTDSARFSPSAYVTDQALREGQPEERELLHLASVDDRFSVGTWQAQPYAEYVEMAARLRSLKGRAIVSLNDHPDIRRAFEGFHIETVDIRYTVGGGGREAARKEVIIFSWDDAAQPAGLF